MGGPCLSRALDRSPWGIVALEIVPTRTGEPGRISRSCSAPVIRQPDSYRDSRPTNAVWIHVVRGGALQAAKFLRLFHGEKIRGWARRVGTSPNLVLQVCVQVKHCCVKRGERHIRHSEPHSKRKVQIVRIFSTCKGCRTKFA